MADYYDTFSANIPFKNEEEKKWLEFTLAYDEDDPRCAESEDFLKVLQEKEIDPDGWARFDWKVIEEHGHKFMHVYNSEGCLEEVLFLFVQSYLKKFRPTEAWSITWNSGCTSMRLDGFSGGAAFITAESIETHIVEDWILDKSAKHEGAVNGTREGGTRGKESEGTDHR